jgi:HK97 family phage prohead protease
MQLIAGYAAVYYRPGDRETEYELWPGAVERILPGAFDDAIKLGDDARGMFDHRVLLGRRSAGTLRLYVDPLGLRYEILPSDTSAYRDTVEHVRLGNVTGSSFAFKIRGADGERWTQETRNGLTVEVREIRAVTLFDVGPVVDPAYVGTTAVAKAPAAPARTRAAQDVELERIARLRYLAKSARVVRP